MNDKPDHGMPVKIDVGASAKLSIDVKADIPPAAAGRLVDALTDIIRPWSEGRGLRADLIRLQREEVALEIARRAALRIELRPDPHPIPLKVLIPLLEKGSQEAPSDDFIIDMWANLLASATAEGSISPRFIGILGEMNSRQAKLLVHIGRERGDDATQGSYSAQQLQIENKLTAIFRQRKKCTP